MYVSSIHQLCQFLISSAIQRCRMSESLCRLSVFIKSSPSSDHPLIWISVSDTGAGSCLEEFQCLKYTSAPSSSATWDGVISLTTTSITDDEICHYHFNLRETVSTRKMTKLPSSFKNGAKFSGTEVSLSIFGNVDDILQKLTNFLEKMLVLKIANVAIDLVVEDGDNAIALHRNLVTPNEFMVSTSAASNIERLKLGLEDYVFKHGNSSTDICHYCFSSGEHLKVGSGVACRMEGNRSSGQVMEAVIIISELPQPTTPSCSRACDKKTEVLYFKDFSPHPVSETSLNGLTSINWKTYGLSLLSVADQNGNALLEWENLPQYVHIDIALHLYHKQVVLPSTLQKTTHLSRTLTRKAVKLALNDLKEKNAGALLSAHAVKICKYAPGLAKTITGLILSSNDKDFQAECLSLLQLQPKGIEGKMVEDCIERKIISVVEMNDRKPQKNREPARFLFEDNHFEEPDAHDEEYEAGEECFSYLDQ